MPGSAGRRCGLLNCPLPSAAEAAPPEGHRCQNPLAANCAENRKHCCRSLWAAPVLFYRGVWDRDVGDGDVAADRVGFSVAPGIPVPLGKWAHGIPASVRVSVARVVAEAWVGWDPGSCDGESFRRAGVYSGYTWCVTCLSEWIRRRRLEMPKPCGPFLPPA